MKHRHRHDYSTRAEISASPLMDVAFILLIVFVIALPLMTAQPPTSTPVGSTPFVGESISLAQPPDESHVITMRKDESLLWDGMPLDLTILDDLLAGFTPAAPPTLLVEFAPSLDAGSTVPLLALFSKHHLTNILFTTIPDQS